MTDFILRGAVTSDSESEDGVSIVLVVVVVLLLRWVAHCMPLLSCLPGEGTLLNPCLGSRAAGL